MLNRAESLQAVKVIHIVKLLFHKLFWAFDATTNVTEDNMKNPLETHSQNIQCPLPTYLYSAVGLWHISCYLVQRSLPLPNMAMQSSLCTN